MEYDNFQKAIDDGVPMVVIHFDPKTHEEIGREEYNLQNVSISEFQAELLARALLPSIYEFYAGGSSDSLNVCAICAINGVEPSERIAYKKITAHRYDEYDS